MEWLFACSADAAPHRSSAEGGAEPLVSWRESVASRSDPAPRAQVGNRKTWLVFNRNDGGDAFPVSPHQCRPVAFLGAVNACAARKVWLSKIERAAGLILW